MTESHGPGHESTTGRGPDQDRSGGLRPPPRPRWVWWLLIAVAGAVVVFLGLHLFLGGGHGPMNHMPGTNHGMPALVVGLAGVSA